MPVRHRVSGNNRELRVPPEPLVCVLWVSHRQRTHSVVSSRGEQVTPLIRYDLRRTSGLIVSLTGHGAIFTVSWLGGYVN